MNTFPQKLTLAQWDALYQTLLDQGQQLPTDCVPLGRFLNEGDQRLHHLRFDNSIAALALWNFLLSEETRLRQAREQGNTLVGTMKDLGTVPIMVYALENCRAFYPDGAWWIPCVMELSDGLFHIADRLGIDDSFCPVRAMLGAFVTEEYFPIPDLLTCSVGAVCDDFSAIAQRLEGLGQKIHWWEIPHRRHPDPEEITVPLPGGFLAPQSQVTAVKNELERLRAILEAHTDQLLTDEHLHMGITRVNQVRVTLQKLRNLVYRAKCAPLPALEMLIAEMLAIHYCSDLDQTQIILEALLQEATERHASGLGYGGGDEARLFWVNPVADLCAMNLVEACGGRICGTDYLFTHALDTIPTDIPPLEALAQMALADPMVGSTIDRSQRICHDSVHFGAEAVVVSRIPGASHCAWEGRVIADTVRDQLGLPVLEIEVSPITDAQSPALQTRIEALVETVKQRRRL